MIRVESIVDEGLGHSSYVVALGDDTALVVDPTRFPERARARRATVVNRLIEEGHIDQAQLDTLKLGEGRWPG